MTSALGPDQRLLEELAVIGGLSAVGAVIGWIVGILWWGLRNRPVAFGEWVAHGAGAGGTLGIVLVLADRLL